MEAANYFTGLFQLSMLILIILFPVKLVSYLLVRKH